MITNESSQHSSLFRNLKLKIFDRSGSITGGLRGSWNHEVNMSKEPLDLALLVSIKRSVTCCKIFNIYLTILWTLNVTGLSIKHLALHTLKFVPSPHSPFSHKVFFNIFGDVFGILSNIWDGDFSKVEIFSKIDSC